MSLIYAYQSLMVYITLYIEMKALDGEPTPEQLELLEELNNLGYMAALAYGFKQARKTIIEYLNL